MRRAMAVLALLVVCTLLLVAAEYETGGYKSPGPTPAQKGNENEPAENENEPGENEPGENENEPGENENEPGENENEPDENGADDNEPGEHEHGQDEPDGPDGSGAGKCSENPGECERDS